MKWLTVKTAWLWPDRICADLDNGETVYLEREHPHPVSYKERRHVLRGDLINWEGDTATVQRQSCFARPREKQFRIIWGKKGARAMALLMLLATIAATPPPLPAPAPQASIRYHLKTSVLKRAGTPRSITQQGKNKPMAKTVAVISRSQPAQQYTPSTVTASWNAVDGATGYLLSIYLDDGTQVRTLDVKNNLSSTVTVAGGFKYLSHVRSYSTLYGHTLYSDGTTEAMTSPTLQPNTVQALRVGNQLRLMMLTPRAGQLQSSPDTHNWTAIAATSSNAPTLYQLQITSGNLYLRTATP